jgi:hypothetical protein
MDITIPRNGSYFEEVAARPLASQKQNVNFFLKQLDLSDVISFSKVLLVTMKTCKSDFRLPPPKATKPFSVSQKQEQHFEMIQI